MAQGNFINHKSKKDERIGEEEISKQGYKMTIVEYKNTKNITIEFDDELKTRLKTTYNNFKRKNISNPNFRVGLTNTNQQGCVMKIVKYTNSRDLWVEFQDDYKYRTHCTWELFLAGTPINPNLPTIYGVGIVGTKYPTMNGNKQIREYKIWFGILQRCYDQTTQEAHPTYKNCYVADEWLYFPNFYEWLHSQSNFQYWNDSGNGEWHIDKDILFKRNKVYSSSTCCIVPRDVNVLFCKADGKRGNYCIGVTYHSRDHVFEANCKNPIVKKPVYLGRYNTEIEAFTAYKNYKEKMIKAIAEKEYKNGFITKRCYEAMMNYEVEITD